MKSIIVSVADPGLMDAGSAVGADIPALARRSGGNGCHAIDKKIVGPAWQDVANKYKGDADAVAKLSTKISKGGSGAWGAVPMPPQPKLSEAETKELAGFVMSLAK